ncbi:hypothetical protein EXIGLDRAFT_707784 [Exidia glandulosa HHB12029]|uniref:Zinc finger C3HC4 RING-type domain-containing protein n=1 Tax=Exidia glandulosa HHB12029 TaxID=1314781 RepID=A0A166NEX7_EXIGL|nr:hypothetical protein EXIGLDRAFT_707784 [Exidia glandulosa HHB12029]
MARSKKNTDPKVYSRRQGCSIEPERERARGSIILGTTRSWYLRSAIKDKDSLVEFWVHLEPKTIPPGDKFPHGWEVYSNQAYRDYRILEDIKRRVIELDEEEEKEKEEGNTSDERAAALRLRREQLSPDRLELALRDRQDFSYTGDYVSEVDSWRFERTPGYKKMASPPFVVAAIKHSEDDLKRIYLEAMQENAQDGEDAAQEAQDALAEAQDMHTATLNSMRDQGLPERMDFDLGDVVVEHFDPAPKTMGYGEDGWPLGLTRIAFPEGQSVQKTLLSALGKNTMRAMTRWWRRQENQTPFSVSSARAEAFECHDTIAELQGKALLTECYHIYCKPCLLAWWENKAKPESGFVDSCRIARVRPPYRAPDEIAREKREREEQGWKKKKRRGGKAAKRNRANQEKKAAHASSFLQTCIWRDRFELQAYGLTRSRSTHSKNAGHDRTAQMRRSTFKGYEIPSAKSMTGTEYARVERLVLEADHVVGVAGPNQQFGHALVPEVQLELLQGGVVIDDGVQDAEGLSFLGCVFGEGRDEDGDERHERARGLLEGHGPRVLDTEGYCVQTLASREPGVAVGRTHPHKVGSDNSSERLAS